MICSKLVIVVVSKAGFAVYEKVGFVFFFFGGEQQSKIYWAVAKW